MNVHIPYEVMSSLNSLSNRLNRLTKKHLFPNYVDHTITSENIRFHLSFLLSKIILNLRFPENTFDAFVEVVNSYNEELQADLNVQSFLDAHYARVINGEVKLPSVVQGSIRRIKDLQKDCDKKIHMLQCLRRFYDAYEDTSGVIASSVLNAIVAECAYPEISVDFLLERGIVQFDKDNNDYEWHDNQYVLHLRNEISAQLWFLQCGDNPSEETFKEFVKCLSRANIWPDRLDEYLEKDATTKICDFSSSVLESESDLADAESEFSKAWLDMPSYHHISIDDVVPTFHFKAKSTVDVIEEVERYGLTFHDFFTHQETRSEYYRLIRFVIQHDKRLPVPYQKVLRHLKDAQKPFLIWSIIEEIGDRFPEVIPYLLTDTSLASLAYKLLGSINIDPDLLFEHEAEKKMKEEGEFVDQIWKEMFNVTKKQIPLLLNDDTVGILLAAILVPLAKTAFEFPANTQHLVKQELHLKRYRHALVEIRDLGRGTINYAYANDDAVLYVVEAIYKALAAKEKQPDRHQYITMPYPLIDLCLELLRTVSLIDKKGAVQNGIVTDLKRKLSVYLKELVGDFYTIEEVNVVAYTEARSTSEKVKRGVNDFGSELVDWGYLCLHLHQHDLLLPLDSIVKATILFSSADSEGKYSEQNSEQVLKLQSHARMLMCAFLGISKNKDSYAVEGFPTDDTQRILQTLIEGLATNYSADDLSSNRVDIFDERIKRLNRPTQPSLVSLLFEFINISDRKEQEDLLRKIFDKSLDLGRMLLAYNIIQSQQLKTILQVLISQVDVDEYLNTRMTITELEEALIESVNSDSNWEAFTSAILTKAKLHYEERKVRSEEAARLLFEVELLMAFKGRNFKALQDLEVAQGLGTDATARNKREVRKTFYISLFHLYHNHDYDLAITGFQNLISSVPTISYAFHLWRAKTLKAISTDDFMLLVGAYLEWEELSSRDDLRKDERQSQQLIDIIRSNSLHYHSYIHNYSTFDQIVISLPKKLLYADDVIDKIYSTYNSRGLAELAFDYLGRASEFYREQHLDAPTVLNNLLDHKLDETVIRNLRLVVGGLRNQSAYNIPKILPEVLNGKKELSLFILGEIVLAINVMLMKIESIRQITHENRYNDLLVATLRLRFPVWGWTIMDQSRVGTAPGGKDAGESDFLIEVAGSPITLWEAFILRDSAYTRKHIKKCEDYVKTLRRFYMIVYFQGKSSDFDRKWGTYKQDVLDMTYSENFEIDKSVGFQDLTTSFENTNHLKLAKTTHESSIELYHAFIDLGE